jgi:hypothetical protein
MFCLVQHARFLEIFDDAGNQIRATARIEETVARSPDSLSSWIETRFERVKTFELRRVPRLVVDKRSNFDGSASPFLLSYVLRSPPWQAVETPHRHRGPRGSDDRGSGPAYTPTRKMVQGRYQLAAA